MQQVGEMNILLSANTVSYSQAIDQAYKKLDALAGKSKQVGHSTVTSVQAASGALRELNGDFTNNIRAVERFITTIPGVGDALKLAFPLVGGLAFGAMLVDAGKKVYDFTRQIAKIPENIRTGFAELNESTHRAGIELDATNDKLSIAIAKLEHKPANLLKLALDEDRLAAANLAGEIDRAKTSIDGLLEKNSVGLWKGLASFFTGDNLDETKPTEDRIKAIVKKLQAAQYGAQDAEDAASPADAASVKLANRKKLQDALTEAIVRTSSALAKEQLADSDDRMNSHAPAIDMLSGTLRQLQNQEHNFQAGNLRSDLTTQQDDLSQRKELATAAREAQRKAQEEQMKVFENGLAQLKVDHLVSTVEEDDYWRKLLAPAQKYPDNLRRVQERLGQVRQAMGREIEEMMRKLGEAQKKHLEQQKQGDAEANRLADEMDAQDRRSADYTAQLTAVRTENVDALSAMKTAHDVASGAISKYDAAVRAATLHAASYRAELKALDDEQKADYADSGMSPEHRAANDQGRNAQREKIQGEADRAALQDQWNAFQQTGLGGATDALNEFAAAARDSSAQIHELISSALGDLNKTLLEQLTTRSHGLPRHLWENTGRSIATSATSSLLKKGEGALLQGFGFGSKADGSSSSPFWVKIVGKSGGDAVSSVLGGGGEISDTDANLNALRTSFTGSGGMGGGGGLFSSLGPLVSNIIPFLADGGDFKANSMAVVGERGPELVRFGRSGSVVPNHEAFGGGETHIHTHNWDLRGAGDPAQVRAVVSQEFARHGPSLVAASVKATHEYQKRRPSSHR